LTDTLKGSKICPRNRGKPASVDEYVPNQQNQTYTA
jgi:hypothetical protein